MADLRRKGGPNVPFKNFQQGGKCILLVEKKVDLEVPHEFPL